MSQDFLVVAESVVTTVGGVSIGSGGSLSIASGSLKLAGGNASFASGASVSIATGVTLAASNITIPGFEFMGAPGTVSVSVATASGTTVPIAQGVVRVSGTAATTSGSCTLATGTADGQQVTIINESANNFVVTGNMKANQTLAASSGMQLTWISADTAWWRLN